MIEYIEEVLQNLQAKYVDIPEGEERDQFAAAINGMQANLDKLRPVINAHNKEYMDLQEREQEMEKLIHEFKNSLLIEKIKMDIWENKTGKK